MIVKTSQGHQVRSESGRNLSKPNLSLKAAKRRLAVVEYFKAKGKKTGEPKAGVTKKGS